jgi:hypothetical protein
MPVHAWFLFCIRAACSIGPPASSRFAPSSGSTVAGKCTGNYLESGDMKAFSQGQGYFCGCSFKDQEWKAPDQCFYYSAYYNPVCRVKQVTLHSFCMRPAPHPPPLPCSMPTQ